VFRWLLSFFFAFGVLGGRARRGRRKQGCPEAENRKRLKGGAQAQKRRRQTGVT